MGNIGKLWFDVGMNDLTDKDLDKIKNNIKKKLKKVDVNIGINIDPTGATDQIKKALTKSPYKVTLDFGYANGLANVKKSLNGIDLKTKISFDKSIIDKLDNAFSNHSFKIKIIVDKAEASQAVQAALAKIGYNQNVTPNDVRAKRYEEIQNRINNANARAAITLQREQLRLQRTQASLDEYESKLSSIMGNMNKFGGVAADLRRQLVNTFSIIGMERFLQSVIEVGGEFQKQKIALSTMYNDFDAGVLFEQVKKLSVISPYEFKDMIGFTKQLAAFNIEYDQVYDTTRRLADISSGLGVDMGRIILAFGQIRAASYLRGGELKQLTEAGVPILDKLAEKLTQINGRLMSTGDVMDAISKREVSFETVREVLWEMTDEGGKFYKMQEELSSSLAGKLANLKDAYDIMLSAIAESNNSDLGGMLDTLTSLLGHWETISEVTMLAIKGVGTYAIACVVLVPLVNSVKALSSAWTTLTIAQRAASIAGVRFSKVFYGLSLLMKSHPIGMLATVLAGAAMALSSLRKNGDDVQEILDKISGEVAELKNSFESLAETDNLIDRYEALRDKTEKTKDETDQLNKMTLQLQGTFKGAVETVDQYGTAMSMSVEKMRELTAEQKNALKAKAEENVDKAVEELAIIEKKIQKQRKIVESYRGLNPTNWIVEKMNNAGFDNAQNILNDLLIQQINAQAAVASARKKIAEMGNEDNTEETLSKWQQIAREAKKASSIIPEVKPSTSLTDYLDDIKKAIDGIEKENKTLSQDNEYTKGLYKKNEDDLKKLSALYAKLGGIRSEADKLKGDIDLIKEAYSEYQKYSKEVGSSKALDIIRSDERFVNLDFDPNRYSKMLSDLQKRIGKANITSKERRSLTNTVSKLIFGVNYEEVKRGVSDMVEKTKNEIEKSSKQWGLYKELYDITGDKDKSFRLAFGTAMTPGIENEIEGMKNILKRRFGKTYEELRSYNKEQLLSLFGTESKTVKNLLEQIEEASDTTQSDILKNALKLVQEYAGIEEKIAVLEKKKEDDLAKLKSSKGYGLLGEEEKLKAEQAILRSYEKQIGDLNSESIKLSDVWQKLFGDTTNMSYRTLQKAAKEARNMVESAKEYKDPKTGATKVTMTWQDEAGKIHTANVKMDTYLQLLKKIGDTEKALAEIDPFSAIVEDLKRIQKAIKENDKASLPNLFKKIANDASTACGHIKDVTNAFAEMFNSYGNEDLADKLNFAGDIFGEIGSLAQGLASGNIVQMAKSALTFIPNLISKIANYHDKKLDKAIQKSQNEVKVLQNEYKNLESEIERTLGEMSEQVYSQQIENLKKQREQISLQIEKENKKKKTDSGKIEDYKQQIKELDEQIRYFAEDTAKNLYGIDLKDWAGKFTDSIVDAWKKGEDAATAFEETASEILANVANEALKMAIIEPLFEDLRKKLPDIMSDGKIDESEMGSIAESLLKVKDGYESSLEYLNNLSDKVYQMTNGEVNLKDTLSSSSSTTSTSSGGIQASEQTMQLTNSYLNAIRQDISVLRAKIESVIAEGALQEMNIVGEAQLQQLNAIAANTASNAKSARIIQEALDSVITSGNGGKAVRIK